MSKYGDEKTEGDSTNWKNWKSALIPTTCKYCADKHGTIYPFYQNESSVLPVHIYCLCKLVPMRTIYAGGATINGINGADFYLIYHKHLPNYYVTKSYAASKGWINYKGNLSEVLPGKMLGGDVYYNDNKKLPVASNRIWYEADINYISGYRNTSRILYSNDGLVFVTYDHYKTFYEIKR